MQFDRRQRRRKKKNSFFKTNNNNVIEQLRRADREPIIDFRNNEEVLLEISKVDCLRRASEKNGATVQHHGDLDEVKPLVHNVLLSEIERLLHRLHNRSGGTGVLMP